MIYFGTLVEELFFIVVHIYPVSIIITFFLLCLATHVHLYKHGVYP